MLLSECDSMSCVCLGANVYLHEENNVNYVITIFLNKTSHLQVRWDVFLHKCGSTEMDPFWDSLQSCLCSCYSVSLRSSSRGFCSRRVVWTILSSPSVTSYRKMQRSCGVSFNSLNMSLASGSMCEYIGFLEGFFSPSLVNSLVYTI